MRKLDRVDKAKLRDQLKGREIIIADCLPGVVGVQVFANELENLGSFVQKAGILDYPPESRYPQEGQDLTVFFCNLGAEDGLTGTFLKTIFEHNIPILIVTSAFPRNGGLLFIARNRKVADIVSADLESDDLVQVVYRILKTRSDSFVAL